MSSIFHIAEPEEWQSGLDTGTYQPSGFEQEGFIHFSTFTQVSPTAARYYAGRRGLVLLEVDENDVQDALRFEASPTGELFPHVYRRLPVALVKAVYPLLLGPDGTFSWPIPPDQISRG
jgi:uncharacterized protein (DUF952 family)